jgi:RimJ/RimL family protein N-acetyltransferase
MSSRAGLRLTCGNSGHATLDAAPNSTERRGVLRCAPRRSCCRTSPRRRPESATRSWLALLIQAYAQSSLGQLAVCRRSDGILIGRCGLSIYEVEKESSADPSRPLRCFWGVGSADDIECTQELEIGYVLHPDSWGNGYATEAAHAIRDASFRTRPVGRLISIIFVGNTPSEAVARKLQMTRSDRAYMFGQQPVWLYQVEREAVGIPVPA